MNTLEHLRVRHNLLKDLVENTEKLNAQHHDMDHNLLITLKKEKLRIKDMILAAEQEQEKNGRQN
jgi:uncharacterized protein YdcH (DUF465 family)